MKCVRSAENGHCGVTQEKLVVIVQGRTEQTKRVNIIKVNFSSVNLGPIDPYVYVFLLSSSFVCFVADRLWILKKSKIHLVG